MEIVEAQITDLELFFEYLEVQLLDNAADDTPIFQPISKQHSQVSERLRGKFRDGFKYKVGKTGWRKLWLLKDAQGHILGHIDLRHSNNSHHVLLGIGVDSSVRKQGFGVKLIELIITFCKETNSIDWLDLNVLANNLPAKNLYLKCGFKIIAEMADCYRIDGKSVSELTMTLCIKNEVALASDL
ncbi:hypothetical protein PCNPT3_04735 [Psychromonas sp. CNPT3]|uniref:GNAT family N-acetyltransferase n=1 Tax=Psychromonas sp. CNPT3 TaxID=314282 RepID=UPI0002C0A56A|nr:GNAT family N-acetyltransferase [Psychromonas sp. CNPT3]AGH80889.1 hypothetical protein PCNPT3_04735 [Psychromonas sp. CNPT3]